MKVKPADIKELLEIVDWFSDWADYEGALFDYFRDEREADRLFQPLEFTVHDDDQGSTNLGLRWYCYRRNDSVVILFNGGRKTNQDPELCNNVKNYFLQAIKLSKAIYEAFENGDLYIENTFELKTKDDAILKI